MLKHCMFTYGPCRRTRMFHCRAGRSLWRPHSRTSNAPIKQLPSRHRHGITNATHAHARTRGLQVHRSMERTSAHRQVCVGRDLAVMELRGTIEASRVVTGRVFAVGARAGASTVGGPASAMRRCGGRQEGAQVIEVRVLSVAQRAVGWIAWAVHGVSLQATAQTSQGPSEARPAPGARCSAAGAPSRTLSPLAYASQSLRTTGPVT